MDVCSNLPRVILCCPAEPTDEILHTAVSPDAPPNQLLHLIHVTVIVIVIVVVAAAAETGIKHVTARIASGTMASA